MIHNVNGNLTDDSFLLQYISFNNFHLSRYSFSLSYHLFPSYVLLCYFYQPAYLSFPLPIFPPTFHFIFDLLFISLSRPSIVPYHFRLLLMFFQICHSVVFSSFLSISVLQPSSPFFLLV